MFANQLELFDRKISLTDPTYFIADIAANHDGSLQRAIDLIHSSAEAGADCAKFQHFTANTIVSDRGFTGELAGVSHQKGWSKSVYEIYEQYHTREEWDHELIKACKAANIHFMTTPYNLDVVDRFVEYVPGFKIGSGDITFSNIIEKVAATKLPVFIATGASTYDEVQECVKMISSINQKICLMQCNTNYTGSIENFKFVNLNVLKNYSTAFPGIILGLSDHTPGHSAVLGAIALGARVIEKHFTDDNKRVGPDHKFALNPETWRDMVNSTRELEHALGDGQKRIEENEKETVVIQRRSIRASKDISKGHTIQESDVISLRPAPPTSITPMHLSNVIGKKLLCDVKDGEYFKWENLE